MAAHLQRETTPASCVTSTGMPAKNAATILKPLVPNPTQPRLQVVQHVADWVALFPRNKHSHPAPLTSFHTPPAPPFSPSLPYVLES